MLDLSAIRSESIAGKIVRYPLRALPRGVVLPIFRGPLRGKKWIVGSFLHRCWFGTYEIEFQRLLAREVQSGTTFYDVGANVGFYSLLAAMLVGPGRVYAFEPLPANLQYLGKHLELNSAHNVKVIELAISDRCGTASFLTEESRGMGRLGSGGDVTVSTSTLDALVCHQGLAPPDYIKMDIEGAEFNALQGAAECFAKYRPVLFLATHGNEVHGKCCELLESWGYQVQIVRSGSERAELMARPRIGS